MISLYKNGDKTDANNYGGINLLDSTYNIYRPTRILNQRLRVITDALLLEEQMGFGKGGSIVDALFVLRHIIEKLSLIHI